MGAGMYKENTIWLCVYKRMVMVMSRMYELIKDTNLLTTYTHKVTLLN